MKPIYILGAGNFAQEVYSEVFLQGDASQYGKFSGYIYLSKLNNPILIKPRILTLSLLKFRLY